MAMPTYEYECRECSYTFEKFQSINDEPLKSCPLCGGQVRRLIGGGSGIIFKGPGFYSTDSRKSQSASTNIKKTSSASEGGSESPSSLRASNPSVGSTGDSSTKPSTKE